MNDTHDKERRETWDRARLEYIERAIVPVVRRGFALDGRVRSAVLMVAQYWNDEADDAVHGTILYSLREDPDLAFYVANARWQSEEEYESVEYDGTDQSWLWSVEGPAAGLVDFEYRGVTCALRWADNSDAIPLFAAFCKEGCDQDMHIAESYAPYCIFRPDKDEIRIEVVGKMLRPWLDGVERTEDEEPPPIRLGRELRPGEVPPYILPRLSPPTRRSRWNPVGLASLLLGLALVVFAMASC